MKTINTLSLLALFVSVGVFGQSGPDMKQNIALIKQNIASSQANIKKYSWIETATVFINGEEKSVTQNQCYYDVTGKLTKVPTAVKTQTKTPGGLRGKIAANKKEDIEAYVEKALAQIKAYIPPQPAILDKIYLAGGVGIKVLAPNKQFELDFPGYLKSGDLLAIQLDVQSKKLMKYGVNTYMDSPADAVTLEVTFQNLPDGTLYSGNTTFNAPSQNLKIVMTHSGYKLGSGQ